MERVREVLTSGAVTQAALADALGISNPATVSNWLTGATKVARVSPERFEEAVAIATGKRARPHGAALDVRSYTAGLLVGLEGDALSIMGRIAEARQALGLGAIVTRPGDGTRGRASLAVAEGREATGRARRRKG